MSAATRLSYAGGTPAATAQVRKGKRIVKNLFLRPPRAREKNYHSISASLTRTKRIRTMSKLIAYRFRASLSVLAFRHSEPPQQGYGGQAQLTEQSKTAVRRSLTKAGPARFRK